MKLIVTAGHNKSLPTIALLDALLHDGHEVMNVLVVNAFQPSRLCSYLRQYGISTTIAKFESHYLQKQTTYLSRETLPIKSYIKSRNIVTSSIRGFCAARAIPFSRVNSLASVKAIKCSQDNSPDLIIYSGGGILRNAFIKTARIGVLNAHSGPLPAIRGMNAIEWSLIEGLEPTTTVHLIDSGIDTGRILHSELIPTGEKDDIYDLRGKAVVHNIELITKVLRSIDEYLIAATTQCAASGKQYFVMHSRIKALLK